MVHIRHSALKVRLLDKTQSISKTDAHFTFSNPGFNDTFLGMLPLMTATTTTTTGEQRAAGSETLSRNIFGWQCEDQRKGVVAVFCLKQTIDRELKKIIAARILTNFVVSVAKGETKCEPKFQPLSSNSLEDMSIFVTVNKDGTDFIIFLSKTWLLLKLLKSKERVKQNFRSPKNSLKITFLKLGYLDIKSNFKSNELHLVFPKIFWKLFTWIIFRLPFTRYSGLKRFSKNLKKIDFSIWVYLDISKNLKSFELHLFFVKNIV